MMEVICSSLSCTSRPRGARMANTSDWPIPVAIRARINTVSWWRLSCAGKYWPSVQAYFSSDDDLPSSLRATINCWICWVPSKMSMILESLANFSSNSTSL